MSRPAGATLTWIAVTSFDELWEGDLLEVSAAGDDVLLAHLPGGELRAYQARCPHQEYPLSTGELDGSVLTCSAHGWEFDLDTGSGVNPSGCTLYRFPVRRDGDRISVGIPADGERHHQRCRDR